MMGEAIVNRVLAVIGSRVGVHTITIVTTPLLVRLLGDAGYGEYAVVLSVLSLSVIVASAGTFDSARKFIAERRSLSMWRSHVFGLYARIVLTISTIVGLIFAAAAWIGFVETLLNESFIPYFYFLALLVPLGAMFKLSRSTLMGLDLESHSEPLFVIERLLFISLALFLVWIGWGVIGVLTGRVIATLFVIIMAVVVINRELDLRSVSTPVPASFPRRDLVSYNTSTVSLNLLMVSLSHLDIVLLGALTSSAITGVYRAALVVAEFLWFAPVALQIGLLHSTSQLWSNGERDQITELSSRAVRLTVVFTLLLVLGVAALAEPLVSIYYGPDFTRATRPLLYLLPGALGYAVARPIFATSQGQSNLRPVLLATSAAAALNLVLNLYLIPQFGAIGAAIATSIGYGSMLLFHVAAAHRLGFYPVRDLRIKRLALSATLSAVPIFGLTWLLPGNILPLLVVPPVGFAIYTTLVIYTRTVDPMEIRAVFAHLPLDLLTAVLPTSISTRIQQVFKLVLGLGE